MRAVARHLINTPLQLQWGAKKRCGNRETVETVIVLFSAVITPLKWGVNESIPSVLIRRYSRLSTFGKKNSVNSVNSVKTRRAMANDTELTPMMTQYRRIKSELPADALLLFRLGDFYEMFFEDAQIGAQLLNVALTKRGIVPMCGIPYHAANTY